MATTTPSPIAHAVSSVTGSFIGVALIIAPVMLIVLIIMLARARGAWMVNRASGAMSTNVAGARLLTGKGRGIRGGAHFSNEIRATKNMLYGYGSMWSAFGLLITDHAVYLTRLVEVKPGSGMYIMVEDPSMPIFLRSEDFVTRISDVPTAVLVPISGGYKAVSWSSAVSALIANAPAIVCAERKSDRTELLDPESTLKIVVDRATGAVSNNGDDLKCFVPGNASATVNALKTGVGVLTIGGRTILVPLNVTELIRSELRSGTGRYIIAQVTEVRSTFVRFMDIVRALTQRTAISTTRILYIGIIVAMVLAILLLFLRHI